MLRHPSTSAHVKRALRAQCYVGMSDAARACHALVADNDVMAAVFARLLLWTLPDRLPTADEPERAWSQYLAAWRPGKPHPKTWDAYFAAAWQRVRDQERVHA